MSESVGPRFRMNTGDEKNQRQKNQKIPFYDLKSHGLIDESDIKYSGCGLFEDDSFLDEQPVKQKNLDILCDKKSKYDLEKEADDKLANY